MVDDERGGGGTGEKDGGYVTEVGGDRTGEGPGPARLGDDEIETVPAPGTMPMTPMATAGDDTDDTDSGDDTDDSDADGTDDSDADDDATDEGGDADSADTDDADTTDS